MPSNAMLAVPAKGAAGFLDIREPIKSYVASQFNRSAASSASESLEKAQKLRNAASEMAGGADEVKEALLGCVSGASSTHHRLSPSTGWHV